MYFPDKITQMQANMSVIFADVTENKSVRASPLCPRALYFNKPVARYKSSARVIKRSAQSERPQITRAACALYTIKITKTPVCS